jgi:hypothetical protein
MIIEVTNYFARPGLAADVLSTRRKASDIRHSLGLPRGNIFLREEGSGPDVRWECVFPNRDEYDRDRQIRKTSKKFDENKEFMHSLLQRFERHVEVPDHELDRD